MIYRVVFLLFFSSLSFGTYGADIFRWVDETGHIHYGESVPDQYKKRATMVEQKGLEPTDAQRQEAAARLAKEKAIAESMTTDRVKSNAPNSVPLPPPAAAGTNDKEDSCEEQKRKFAESQVCFAPYRNATGGIKAEAYQHCVELTRPQC
jgi:hypothetical protein